MNAFIQANKPPHKTGASPQAKNSETSTAVRPSRPNSRRTGTKNGSNQGKVAHFPDTHRPDAEDSYNILTSGNHSSVQLLQPRQTNKNQLRKKTLLQPTPRDNEQKNSRLTLLLSFAYQLSL